MCRSRMMQSGRKELSACRKSDPDSKVLVSNIDARKSLPKALRTDASSSTTAIRLLDLGMRKTYRFKIYCDSWTNGLYRELPPCLLLLENALRAPIVERGGESELAGQLHE